MMKKIILLGCLFIFSAIARNALAEGQVILELDKGRPETQDISVPQVIEMGARYINDVKEYNELLAGQNIEKDITSDIRAKHPQYSEEAAEEWQRYVKKGIDGYRIFEKIKEKIVSSLLSFEMPLVVADDQYEMGDDEAYIDSDSPLIVHDFKKVVAYSNQNKDRLAAQEKYAKDHNLMRPSVKMALLRKAVMEKDWAKVFGFDLKQWIKNVEEIPNGKYDIYKKEAYAYILSRFNGVNETKTVEGVISVVPAGGRVVLKSNYLDYKGLRVDFSQSENIENPDVHFIMPALFKTNDNSAFLGYASSFPIYFKAKVKDVSKPVKLNPLIEMTVCFEQNCNVLALKPELELAVKDKIQETINSTYIMMVSKNIPRAENQRFYKFNNLVLEKDADGNPDFVRLEIVTKDAVYLKVLLYGDEAEYFEAPLTRLDDGKVFVRFKLKDKTFNPLGKELKFWVATNGVTQYLHKMPVEEPSVFDVEQGGVTLGILWLAFIGGMFLNFMPCVFPVLSLKLLAFTRFGGLNKDRIRRNFMYNSLGILVSFVLMAVVLSGLKLSGQVLGWGMQFQNVYFLVAVIWIVALFLAHVLGTVNLKTPAIAGKILDKTQKGGRLFEFLSGVFLVLLSTPCMAPYLGTAFGVALAGDVIDICLVVLFVGLGVSVPYLLFVICPDLAVYMPKPGKWLGVVNFGMILLLIVTLWWLIHVLSIQAEGMSLRFWSLCIAAMLFLFWIRKIVATILDTEKRKYKTVLNIVCSIMLMLLIGYSVVVVKNDVAVSSEAESNDGRHYNVPDKEYINQLLRTGWKLLVKVEADWCLTCQYNDALVLDSELLEDNKVEVWAVDWTRHNDEVIKFMQHFGRRGVPFYVLFSVKFPDGVVLPEMLNAQDIRTLVDM